MTEWNRAAEATFGVAAHDALGAPWERVVPAARQEVVDEVKAALQAGKRWEGEFPLVRGSESVFLYVTDSPIIDSRGATAGVVCVAVDITERKRLEEQLVQARKTEAVARVVAGLTHDFGNLLGLVQGYAHLLVEELRAGAAGRDYADQIVDAAERAKILIRRLLAPGVDETIRVERVDANRVLRDLGALLGGVAASGVEVKTRLASRLWPIEIDPTQLEQVII